MTGASHKTIAPDEFQIPRVITPFPAPKLSHLPMVLYSRLFLFCTFLLLVFLGGNLNLELLVSSFKVITKKACIGELIVHRCILEFEPGKLLLKNLLVALNLVTSKGV